MHSSDAREITPTALLELLQQSPSTLLLDVRKQHDFDADPVFIPGAEYRLPEQVAEWLAELPDAAEIIVYCVHGHAVSNGILDQLLAAGRKARLLSGGIDAWKQAGAATVSL